MANYVPGLACRDFRLIDLHSLALLGGGEENMIEHHSNLLEGVDEDDHALVIVGLIQGAPPPRQSQKKETYTIGPGDIERAPVVRLIVAPPAQPVLAELVDVVDVEVDELASSLHPGGDLGWTTLCGTEERATGLKLCEALDLHVGGDEMLPDGAPGFVLHEILDDAVDVRGAVGRVHT